MNNNHSTQKNTVSETKQSYENNPLYVATTGLDLLFKKALSLGILFAILSALSAFSGVPSSFIPDNDTQSDQNTASMSPDATNFMNAISNITVEMWLFIAVIILTVVAFATVVTVALKGISDVTAAHLARGESTGVTDALREVFSNFWGYLWVILITNVKIFLWTLLLIIPGIIMAIRYSLSGVVYFDKKLKGNESVKESSRLTKGAWLTTFASQNLLNILTLGFITPLLAPGTNAVLYRQYSAVAELKPKAHWLTLAMTILLGMIALILLSLLFWASANYLQTT
ncbi:MAG: hypothetical protein ABIR46_02045 [Candidatus Saccharimonadales bacterium]